MLLMTTNEARSTACPMTGFRDYCRGAVCPVWRWRDGTAVHREVDFRMGENALVKDTLALRKDLLAIQGSGRGSLDRAKPLIDGAGAIVTGSWPAEPGWELERVVAFDITCGMLILHCRREISPNDRRGYCGAGGKPEVSS